jgi:antitoxin VapB
MATAKVFWSGRSQAVRLPKEFRVEGDEVRIRREGNTIVLEPIPSDWAWLAEWRAKYGHLLDNDFIAAVNEEVPQQERPELDDLFK